jgi:hypothetical protein
LVESQQLYEWVYVESDAFDFIHGRGMAGSIKNWEKLYSEAFKHLKPGGFLEMQEYEAWIRSADGTLDNCPNIIEWMNKTDEAGQAFGKRMNVGSEQKEKIIAADFENVTEVIHKVIDVTLNIACGFGLTLKSYHWRLWAKDPRQKEIGRYELV